MLSNNIRPAMLMRKKRNLSMILSSPTPRKLRYVQFTLSPSPEKLHEEKMCIFWDFSHSSQRWIHDKRSYGGVLKGVWLETVWRRNLLKNPDLFLGKMPVKGNSEGRAFYGGSE